MNNRPPQHTLTRGARAWLRMGLAGLGGLPGEGKEVLEAGVEPALAELVEDVAEVVPGVAQAGLFGAADEGVEDGEAAGAVVAAGEEPVLAADGDGAQRRDEPAPIDKFPTRPNRWFLSTKQLHAAVPEIAATNAASRRIL